MLTEQGTLRLPVSACFARNGRESRACVPTLQILPRRRQVVPLVLRRPVVCRAAHHRLCGRRIAPEHLTCCRSYILSASAPTRHLFRTQCLAASAGMAWSAHRGMHACQRQEHSPPGRVESSLMWLASHSAACCKGTWPLAAPSANMGMCWLSGPSSAPECSAAERGAEHHRCHRTMLGTQTGALRHG